MPAMAGLDSMPREWAFMPIGNADLPLMFVRRTGRGDGVYKVERRILERAPKHLIYFIY